tara:strand:+ start:132 stop:299 length:168 start_codon:yes stop_codon:yes gene_type:complete
MENKVAVVTEKLSEAVNNPLECWIMGAIGVLVAYLIGYTIYKNFIPLIKKMKKGK